MPFDNRPVSRGGNRGLGETFTNIAPKGKFRVIGVDTFDGGDWVQGDFDTREEALTCVKEKGGQMTKMHAYDDTGRHIGEGGTF